MARVIWRAGKAGIAIIVPLVLMGLLLYVLNLLAVGQTVESSVEATEPLSEFEQAQVLRDKEAWLEAERIYQAVLQEQAGTPDALAAARELVMLYIESEQGQKAEEAFASLQADFAGYEGYVQAQVWIADEYRTTGNLDRAKAIYAEVMANYPDDEPALWAEAGLTMCNILSDAAGRDTTEIDAFLSSHAKDARMLQVTYGLAETCRQGEHLEQARHLYRYVAQQWPQADNALWSRMHLAIADIELGERHKAAEGFDQMMAEYGTDSRISVAGCLIADAYRKNGYHAKAREIYQSTIEAWPQSHHALWCQMGLMLSDIALHSDSSPLDKVDLLLACFPGDDRLPNAINQIADQCRRFQRHDEAAVLYRYVIQTWPAAEQTVWCRMGLAIMESQDARDPNGTPELDALLAAEAADPSLPLASFLVGEEYRNHAMHHLETRHQEKAYTAFLKAAGVWERIVGEVPESVYSPESYYQLADCYYGLGRYGDAIRLYQYIVDRWPDFRLSWHCQFLVGYRCNELRKAGGIAASQAEPQIREAYTRLVDLYPHCPAASAASDWLSRHSN